MDEHPPEPAKPTPQQRHRLLGNVPCQGQPYLNSRGLGVQGSGGNGRIPALWNGGGAMGLWLASTFVLCVWCHRQCEIQESRFNRFWRSSVRFCPFCGHSLGVNDLEMAAQGYEKAEG